MIEKNKFENNKSENKSFGKESDNKQKAEFDKKDVEKIKEYVNGSKEPFLLIDALDSIKDGLENISSSKLRKWFGTIERLRDELKTKKELDEDIKRKIIEKLEKLEIIMIYDVNREKKDGKKKEQKPSDLERLKNLMFTVIEIIKKKYDDNNAFKESFLRFLNLFEGIIAYSKNK